MRSGKLCSKSITASHTFYYFHIYLPHPFDSLRKPIIFNGFFVIIWQPSVPTSERQLTIFTINYDTGRYTPLNPFWSSDAVKKVFRFF